MDERAGAGHISVHDDVVMSLAAWAALGVPGVAGLVARSAVWRQIAAGAVHAVHVDHQATGIGVEVSVAVDYGQSIPAVAEAVALAVRQTLRTMAGIEALRVATQVVGVRVARSGDSGWGG